MDKNWSYSYKNKNTSKAVKEA